MCFVCVLSRLCYCACFWLSNVLFVFVFVLLVSCVNDFSCVLLCLLFGCLMYCLCLLLCCVLCVCVGLCLVVEVRVCVCLRIVVGVRMIVLSCVMC